MATPLNPPIVVGVSTLRWIRADLARVDSPTGREEVPFLLVTAVAVVAGAQLAEPGAPGALVSLALAGLVVVCRALWRRWPAEPFVLGVCGFVGLAVGNSGDLEVGLFLVVVMVLYASWHTGSELRASAMAAVSAAVPLVLSQVVGADMGWVPWSVACGFMFVLGRNLRRQRMLIDELHVNREALAAAAVSQERQRIARELHDLTGHTLAAMMLHVTGARHVLRRDTEEAERALLEAEDVGRSSLGQVRRVVAALRSTESGLDPSLAGAADLEATIEEYRRAGLRVESNIAAEVVDVPSAVGVAAHRILREALANVARHAPRHLVVVDVHVDADVVRVAVRDRGRTVAAPDPAAGQGFGLVGMRERARALGGELDAGPVADGWLVEATLPLTGAESSAVWG
jgi:signal transduction histidine kinase